MKLKLFFLVIFYLPFRETNELVCYSTDDLRWDMTEIQNVTIPKNLVNCNGDNHTCCFREEHYSLKRYNGTVTQYEKASFRCLKKNICHPTGFGLYLVKRDLIRYLRNANIIYNGKVLLYKIIGVECDTDACNPPVSISRRRKRQLFGGDQNVTNVNSQSSSIGSMSSFGSESGGQPFARYPNSNPTPYKHGYRRVILSSATTVTYSILNLYGFTIVRCFHIL